MAVVDLSPIRNFYQLAREVGTAGQPEAEQFVAIADAGYQVVINLALDDSPNAVAHERELVQAEGMQYVHIPVLFDNPQVADAHKFFVAMQTHRGEKIFVHCAANKRVAVFLFLYRVLHESVAEATALADLHEVWTPDATWQSFIDEVRKQ